MPRGGEGHEQNRHAPPAAQPDDQGQHGEREEPERIFERQVGHWAINRQSRGRKRGYLERNIWIRGTSDFMVRLGDRCNGRWSPLSSTGWFRSEHAKARWEHRAPPFSGEGSRAEKCFNCIVTAQGGSESHLQRTCGHRRRGVLLARCRLPV